MTKRLAMLMVGGLMLLVGFGLMARDTVLLYTSVPIEIVTRLQKAFETAYPDIKLDIYRAGTGVIAAKIATEKEAGRILADLVWVADYTYLEDLKKQDLLYKYLPPEAASVPAALVDPDGYYAGGRVFTMVIAYNTNLVTDPPQRWTDLLDPKWKGELVTGNPEYSGSNVVAAAVLGMEYGLSYFHGLRENEMAVVRGNSEAAAAVIAGEYMVGLTLDNVVREQQALGLPIGMVYPEDGPIFLLSPVGIMSTSRSLEAAKTFAGYVLSVEGQQALVELGMYLPVRLDVPGPVGAPTLTDLMASVMPYTVREIEINKDFFSREYLRILVE
ncbi:MAG: ABC transporter substrate-binding protein [Candidatus Bipolaricaulota bacterium]|jgi:iron(III) transport system substrate-binding protein